MDLSCSCCDIRDVPHRGFSQEKGNRYTSVHLRIKEEEGSLVFVIGIIAHHTNQRVLRLSSKSHVVDLSLTDLTAVVC